MHWDHGDVIIGTCGAFEKDSAGDAGSSSKQTED